MFEKVRLFFSKYTGQADTFLGGNGHVHLHFLTKTQNKKIRRPFKTIDRLTGVCYLSFVANQSYSFTSVKHSGDYFYCQVLALNLL